MTTVLGIDAAWTAREPSGVALVRENQGRWQVLGVQPSYNAFIQAAENQPFDWKIKSVPGCVPDMGRLLGAAETLAGEPVQVITLDMPISRVPFHTRRAADNEISKAFANRWCGTHSPTRDRPGELGYNITRFLLASGYDHAVSRRKDHKRALKRSYFMEVYPHVALLSLLGKRRRVPYKISKSNKYWPGTDISTRKNNLLDQFKEIHQALALVFQPLDLVLPAPEEVPSLSFLKRYEDALDALICAWVGVQFLKGKTVPLGDSTAAVWCPEDVVPAI